MRRALRIAVVCLLLGAAVNVAVAWGCALWSPVRTAKLFNAREAPTNLRRFVPAEWLEVPTGMSLEVRVSRVKTGAGVTVETHKIMLLPTGGGGHLGWGPGRPPYVEWTIMGCRAGWPMRCLEAGTTNQGGLEVGTAWRGGVKAPKYLHALTERALPLLPRWRGLAINTAVYGAACWMLVGGPLAVRRLRRVLRGFCVGCGYPVRGLVRCPECGASAPTGGES